MADPDFNIAGYLQFLEQRKIMACRCLDSGQIYLPPRADLSTLPVPQHGVGGTIGRRSGCGL